MQIINESKSSGELLKVGREIAGTTGWEILESIPDAFFILDDDSRIVYLNNAAVLYFQRPKDQLLNKVIWEEYPESVHLKFYTGYQQVKATQQRVQLEEYFEPHGRWYYCDVYPTDAGVFCFYRDITERKRTEKRVVTLENKLKCLFDYSPIGLVSGNTSGLISDANSAFLQLMGYTDDDLKQGKLSWRALTPKKYTQVMNESISRLNREGESVVFEKEYLKKDGTSVPVFVGVTMVDASLGECIVFVVDLSEKREIERVEMALVASEKEVTSRDIFSSIASHELKTPLTNICLQLQLLQMLVRPDTFYKESHSVNSPSQLMNMLEQSVKRAVRLVDQLTDVNQLALGRMEIHIENINLLSLIDQIVGTFEVGKNGASSAIEVRCSKNLQLGCDPLRMGQVISNLVSNALKFGQGKPIVIEASEFKKKVRIEVKDQGAGIPKEKQKIIFDLFNRVKDPRGQKVEGLGIGLFVTKQIVSVHGGQMSVESQPGFGSTFIVDLPRRRN